ncbi:hypothetical protein BC833DRAFT_612359 [Globomyces pollinis-pini]|nr:hypothetical protein BC833DRAFT_612359 [Globomyces pollinis-pini]
MRSYALYRIASTIHFLLFFFVSIMFFDFALPDLLIILIAVLNDAATLVIAVDNARISKRPDKWRLGQLLTLSFILGALLMIISFGHFFVAKHFYPYEPFAEHVTEDYNYKYIQTIMYLQISSCPHFVIFSTRLGSWWWKSMPSWTFLIAIIGTQIIAGIITIVGPTYLKAVPIGYGWTLGVLGISLAMFMLLDIVKVYVFKFWSFEFTAMVWPTKAQKEKLAARKARKIVHDRVTKNIKKVKTAFRVIMAVNAFKNPSPAIAKNKSANEPVIVQVGSSETISA